MKRYLQLLGELRNSQRSQAMNAIREMEPGDELVIVAPEQSVADEIHHWASSQGYAVSTPKKIGEGIPRWHLTLQKPWPVETPQASAPVRSPTHT
jgi:TusA-related sulfurtransferase